MRNALMRWLVCLSLTVACATAQAGPVELLIAKLVDKGVLTSGDAQDLRSAIALETPGRAALPVQQLAAPAVGTRAPAQKTWADRVSLKGDLRMRRQIEELAKAAATPLDLDEQDRWRLRWRAGLVANVSEQWEVGFGFASGGAGARSTNQTLRRAFDTPDARLDYAYARYSLSENSEVLVGKFRNPLWAPKDLLWDSDLRPEGAALPFSVALSDAAELFVIPAWFVLTEDVSGSRDHAEMLALQVGVDISLSDTVDLRVAPAYYDFNNLEGTPGPIGVDAATNTRLPGGNLAFSYDALTLGVALSVTDVGIVPKLSVFGEWVNATDPDRDEAGWLLGFSVGDAKVSALGDWQAKYNYRRLEADAWPEFLPDSDFFFGATNVKGSEFEFVYGLGKGANVSLDYYHNAELLGTPVEQDLLQIDLNVKW